MAGDSKGVLHLGRVPIDTQSNVSSLPLFHTAVCSMWFQLIFPFLPSAYSSQHAPYYSRNIPQYCLALACYLHLQYGCKLSSRKYFRPLTRQPTLSFHPNFPRHVLFDPQYLDSKSFVCFLELAHLCCITDICCPRSTFSPCVWHFRYSLNMSSIKLYVQAFDQKVAKSTFGRVFRLDGSGHVCSE